MSDHLDLQESSAAIEFEGVVWPDRSFRLRAIWHESSLEKWILVPCVTWISAKEDLLEVDHEMKVGIFVICHHILLSWLAEKSKESSEIFFGCCPLLASNCTALAVAT